MMIHSIFQIIWHTLTSLVQITAITLELYFVLSRSYLINVPNFSNLLHLNRHENNIPYYIW